MNKEDNPLGVHDLLPNDPMNPNGISPSGNLYLGDG